jgi:PAS domain S-box-containing protein
LVFLLLNAGRITVTQITGGNQVRLYFYVSVLYGIVNPLLAGLILIKARRNVLSQFYAFCVGAMVMLGAIWFSFESHPIGPVNQVLEQASAFLYSFFPFFFLHFMLVFLRRHEIANSKTIVLATYSAGVFCYVLVLLKLISLPFSSVSGMNHTAYVYFVTWMSMLFAIGVALLYSLIGGFRERSTRSNILFVSFALLMLLLPTPFTLSVFSVISDESSILYFGSSMMSLAIIIFLVFRHRVTMNTPYQAMKAALSAMNDVILKTDADFAIEFVQGAVGPLLGYAEQDLLEANLADLVQQRKGLEEYRDQAKAGKGRDLFFDTDIVCKDGATIPMEFSLTPVYGNEEVVGFVGVGRNIEERRRAEQALLESESRYRLLFESNPSPMWVYDRATLRILLVNAAAIRHYGYAPEDFQKLTVADITSPDGVLVGISCTAPHRRSNGTTFEAEVIAHDISFGVHPARLVLVNDITERKAAEEEIRVSQEKYRRFFTETLTGYMCATPSGKLVECNPAFLRIMGFANVGDALGSNVRALYPSAAEYDAMIRRVRQKGHSSTDEGRLIRTDGTTLHVIKNVVGSRSESGELTELRTYIVDITRKKMLEDELRHAQKMENLGSLAGGIAHDFNNILAIISVHASILVRTKPQEEKVARSVEALRDASKRGAALARQLLTFARKQDVNFEPVDLNDILDDMVKLIGPTFPKTIAIHLEKDQQLPSILADSNQLQQVLMNLCVNARDAMASGGELTIRSSRVTRDDMKRRSHNANEEEYVCLAVTDTGMGMDDATRSRIFEPFFTTKGVGKGTGLGLAVVYGIVKSHQGFIEVESEPGRGTTFRTYFQTARAHAEETGRDEEPVEHSARGVETILFVEDEPLLAVPLHDLLEEHGYRVITAQDGLEAVEMFRQHKDQIDIVISDIGLPKQNGWEAFLQMREIEPSINAILASGNFDLSKKEEMLDHGVSQFVQKPYVIEEVLGMVRNVLDNRKSVMQ